MCTKPRIIVPGVYYHVTSRGIAAEEIFPNQDMILFFLKEVKETLEKYSFKCLGWSVQKNHYHLILKSSDVPISLFLQRLNSNYAKYFNKESSREGVVFYRRFASIIVQKDRGLKELIRYVHLNPIRCDHCKRSELADYQWSGHSAAMKNIDDGILDREEMLGCFDNDIQQYYDFMAAGCDKSDPTIENVRNANKGAQNFSKSESWVIGDAQFISYVLLKDRSRKARIARHELEQFSLAKLHSCISERFDVKFEDFFKQGRNDYKSKIRQVFVYTGKYRFDFSGKILANYLGITGSAVSRMISRAAILFEHTELAETIELMFDDSAKELIEV